MSGDVMYVRFSRRSKLAIGHSRTANVALQYLLRLRENDPEKLAKIVNDPELNEALSIVTEDGRSRLIIDRRLRYEALTIVRGNARLLKAVIYLLATKYISELSAFIAGELYE